MPSEDDAELLAEVRLEMGALMGIPVQHTTANAVRERYSQLLVLKALKQASVKGGRRQAVPQCDAVRSC